MLCIWFVYLAFACLITSSTHQELPAPYWLRQSVLYCWSTCHSHRARLALGCSWSCSVCWEPLLWRIRVQQPTNPREIPSCSSACLSGTDQMTQRWSPPHQLSEAIISRIRLIIHRINSSNLVEIFEFWCEGSARLAPAPGKVEADEVLIRDHLRPGFLCPVCLAERYRFVYDIHVCIQCNVLDLTRLTRSQAYQKLFSWML